MITIHRTDNVIRGKIGTFVLDLKLHACRSNVREVLRQGQRRRRS